VPLGRWCWEAQLLGAVQCRFLNGVVCEYYKFVWESCTPPKVKFLGWLLLQDRIQTKKNLLKKHCIDNDTCEVCGLGMRVPPILLLVAPSPLASGVTLASTSLKTMWPVFGLSDRRLTSQLLISTPYFSLLLVSLEAPA
jgi:hypothetical protein